MLIREVTAQKPQSPQQLRVTVLQRQLDQARVVAQRQRLAARQARLNQQRATLNKDSAQ